MRRPSLRGLVEGAISADENDAVTRRDLIDELRPSHLLGGLALAVAGPATVTAVGLALPSPGGTVAARLYLLAVIGATWVGGLFPGLLAGLTSFLLLAYFLIAPRGEFTLTTRDALSLVEFLVVAFLFAHLLARSQNARKRAEDAERRYRGLFELAHEPIAVARRDGSIVEANEAWQQAFRSTERLPVPEGYDLTRVASGDRASFEFDARGGDGRRSTFELSARVVDDGEGWIQVIARDVSDRKRAEEQLRRLADFDSLTGLLNRRRFLAELKDELTRLRRDGGNAALVVLDLDNLKAVNDRFGHAAGDAVLRATGRAIKGRVRETDLAARLSGDEFAVFIDGVDPSDARQRAERLAAAIREWSAEAPGGPLTASVGVVSLPAEPRASAEDLLGLADLTMYDAKRAGRDRVMTPALTA